MIILHDISGITHGPSTISIDRGRMHFVSSASGSATSSNALHLHLEHCLAFPGLINSHDHLDFDLFPSLGNRVYNDYLEWGRDIHVVNKEMINQVLQVPRQLRVQWGVYKNLLNGITTVVHHGHAVPVQEPPIEVFQHCHMLHSVQLEKRWKLKLNNPFAGDRPWVIHIGEGTNANAHTEVRQLIKWNLLRRKLIGIHGIAMNEKNARAFEALVWCPDSNFFLIGATARIDQLKKNTTIVFGTDSTLSASWSIWEQLRIARRTGLLTDEELFQAVTATPASLWKLGNTGKWEDGMQADLVVAKQKNKQFFNAFYDIDTEDILLVMKKGKIILFDASLRDQLMKQVNGMDDCHPVYIQNTCKYVTGELPALIDAIHQYAPALDLPVKSTPGHLYCGPLPGRGFM